MCRLIIANYVKQTKTCIACARDIVPDGHVHVQAGTLNKSLVSKHWEDQYNATKCSQSV